MSEQPHPADIQDIQLRDDAHFQAELKALVQRGEDMRLKRMREHRTRRFVTMSVSILLLLAGAAGFGWFLLMQYQLVMALVCLAAAALPSLLLQGWIDGPLKAYAHDYKQLFLPEMAKALGGFRYAPKRGVSSKLLKKTQVVPPYAAYQAEDCFMGRYKGVKVIWSEAKLFGPDRTPFWRGLFVMMEAPEKVFEGHTIITTDQSLQNSPAAQNWQGFVPVTLDVEQKDLQRRFQVFSTAPDKAPNMVTERLLKELGEAADAFNDTPLTAVLLGGKYVFIMITNDDDMFEASAIHIPVSTSRYTMRTKKEIDRIIEIIDIFGLYAPKS